MRSWSRLFRMTRDRNQIAEPVKKEPHTSASAVSDSWELVGTADGSTAQLVVRF